MATLFSFLVMPLASIQAAPRINNEAIDERHEQQLEKAERRIEASDLSDEQKAKALEGLEKRSEARRRFLFGQQKSAEKMQRPDFETMTEEERAALIEKLGEEKVAKMQEQEEALRRLQLWKENNPDATAEEVKAAAIEAGLEKREEAARRFLFSKSKRYLGVSKEEFQNMTDDEKKELRKELKEKKAEVKQEKLEKAKETRRRWFFWQKKQAPEVDAEAAGVVTMDDIAPGIDADDLENEEIAEAVQNRRSWFFWQTQRNKGERAELPEEGKSPSFFKGLKGWVSNILSN